MCCTQYYVGHNNVLDTALCWREYYVRHNMLDTVICLSYFIKDIYLIFLILSAGPF